MRVTVIDGHGGMLGAQLVRAISARFPDVMIQAGGD